MAMPSYVLLYDRDCGICSAFSRWIHIVDVRGRIRFQSIQSGRALLKGVPEERMLDAWHIVAPMVGSRRAATRCRHWSALSQSGPAWDISFASRPS